jgi:small multidrug resistance family-3 protein
MRNRSPASGERGGIVTAPGTLAIYIGAALAEIAGCFAVWAWMRQGASALWLVPGLLSLAVFAWLLTLAPSDFAGRAYAAYGGVYIAASLLWLWLIEKQRPDAWDMAGAAICLLGAAIIPFCAPGRLSIDGSPFNRMCIAQFVSSCHAFPMSWLARSFLMVLLAVSLFGATRNDVSAGLSAEIAASADPCCEGDCPDDPACGAPCKMLARGDMTMLALAQVSGLSVIEEASEALLMLPDLHPPSGLPLDGVRRPPRI